MRQGRAMSPQGGFEGEWISIQNYCVAGMLHHLPAMCLFVAPSPASYDRIQPHTWSGAFQ